MCFSLIFFMLMFVSIYKCGINITMLIQCAVFDYFGLIACCCVTYPMSTFTVSFFRKT